MFFIIFKKIINFVKKLVKGGILDKEKIEIVNNKVKIGLVKIIFIKFFIYFNFIKVLFVL